MQEQGTQKILKVISDNDSKYMFDQGYVGEKKLQGGMKVNIGY